MNDDQVEQAQANSDIPRVKAEHINQLHSTVEYVTVQPEGTTSTFCHAYLPGKDGRKFLLATGMSACVEPALFNAQIGLDIAKGKAITAAKDALWLLEGYHLFKQLEGGAA